MRHQITKEELMNMIENGNLSVRLYNRTFPADLYRSAKKYGFEDLILVPYVNTVYNGSLASIRITKDILNMLGISKTALFDTALAKAKEDIKIEPLGSILSAIAGEKVEEGNVPIHVITNGNCMYGAASVLFIKERLRRIFPKGYYILPSSIHEVLAVPKKVGVISELSHMVDSINGDVVDPAEQLSNHAYEF